jgi:hypothetical protein
MRSRRWASRSVTEVSRAIHLRRMRVLSWARVAAVAVRRVLSLTDSPSARRARMRCSISSGSAERRVAFFLPGFESGAPSCAEAKASRPASVMR